MGLKRMTCRLPSDVLNDVVSVDEIKSYDTDLTVHEKVPFTLNKFLRKWKNSTMTHTVKIVIVMTTMM